MYISPVTIEHMKKSLKGELGSTTRYRELLYLPYSSESNYAANTYWSLLNDLIAVLKYNGKLDDILSKPD